MLRELRRVCRPGGWLLVDRPGLPGAVVPPRHRQPPFPPLRARIAAGASVAAGWHVARTTSFNSLLLAPAAVVRLAQRRRPLNDDYTPDLHIGPDWLNGVLELPLRAEARWLRAGRTLPAGLSLLAVMQNPPVTARRDPALSARRRA